MSASYPSSSLKLKVALVQMAVGPEKKLNISNALRHIRRAHERGAQLVVLPECFNSPYGIKYFKEYAEEVPGGETTAELEKVAKELKIVLVGGTIPERHDGRLYNTSIVFSSEGLLLAKYRKMHLFDINILGKISFQESTILSGGNQLASFPLAKGLKGGLGICYDLRFPEFASLMTNHPAHQSNVLIYPSAFNTTTGPMHWHLLQRARAVDQQSYVLTCSPARPQDPDAYPAYGHSLVVAPTGEIIAEAGESEEIVMASLDPDLIKQVRTSIPVLKQKRTDVYTLPTSK